MAGRKNKTHKGLAKRIKITGTGKVMRHRAGKGHLLSGKSGTRLQKLGKATTVPKRIAQQLKSQLYG